MNHSTLPSRSNTTRRELTPDRIGQSCDPPATMKLMPNKITGAHAGWSPLSAIPKPWVARIAQFWGPARSSMSTDIIKRTALLGLISLAVVGAFAALRTSLRNGVEIRGTLSPRDVAEITRLHRSACPIVLRTIFPKWFPISVQRHISATLNPIEVVAVPGDGRAIVVYRGFEQYYYDARGKHRWGHGAYRLAKDANGWQVVP